MLLGDQRNSEWQVNAGTGAEIKNIEKKNIIIIIMLFDKILINWWFSLCHQKRSTNSARVRERNPESVKFYCALACDTSVNRKDW